MNEILLGATSGLLIGLSFASFFAFFHKRSRWRWAFLLAAIAALAVNAAAVTLYR
jgi:hypothetical protein